MRLFGLASEYWPQLEAAYYQIDLLRQRPNRLLNLVYAWAIERLASDKLEQWIADLYEILPWQDIESETAINLESESFFAAQAKGGR